MFTAPWGGSEELWSQSALELARLGHSVSACVTYWPQPSKSVVELARQGIAVRFWKWTTSMHIRVKLSQLLARIGKRPPIDPLELAHGKWLRKTNPDLVCVSDGGISNGLGWAKVCERSGIPFALLGHANAVHWWPEDMEAVEIRRLFSKALGSFFVSQANRQLFEMQIGLVLSNAEVVRNPCAADYDQPMPWPESQPGEPIRLACVGRLEPASKGQDILLEVLSRDEWRSRDIVLSFFGQGANEESLKSLTARLGLGDKVRFAGHVSGIKEVWASHHALVLPSRYEGLPLVVVEAMMCGRIPIVTDVAGNKEVVTDGEDGFLAEAPTITHLARAMERAWNERERWPEMGSLAASNIRKLVPANPAREFANRLLSLTAQPKSEDKR